MVSIDLDNIIHYHPAPMSKPPCKPPHLTTSSRGSSHPPSNQPVLMHPLPPRPPCLSHESPQTCHPRRQSPSPAVSSVRRDRDAHLNDFDKELANLEMAEFGSQETPELCFGGTEETQAEDINDIQRKELHDQHGGASHSDDRFTNDSRILSEGPTTPQDTAASSDSPGTDLSSAASAPTCPIEADGSVSPNEPCPLQDPTPTERNETQLSAFGCETDVNIVAAGNVSTDQAPSPNPSTPVPAEDEPEPANQRLFRQRRPTTTKIQPAQARRESPHRVFSSPAPEQEIANPRPATSLQDIQTIPVRGFLTRQTFLSRVIYSCTFQEDRQPSYPHGPTKVPAYDKNLDNTRHATQSSSKKQPARASRFLPDEDDRLIELKEERGLPWSRIVKHFPGRTKGSL
ncbi:hypothetical protein E8E15_001784 [Penicillium rubens]|nr:hypothetical protein E8E15_001784 [Penicillium rubens]